jgi:hypothetical protein
MAAMPTTIASTARTVSSAPTVRAAAGALAAGGGAGAFAGAGAAGRDTAAPGFPGTGGAGGAGAAAALVGAAAVGRGICWVAAVVGAAAGRAGAADGAAPVAGNEGNLIVGAEVGFGGNAMRTVSFLGCTLAASGGFGGTPPGGTGEFGVGSAIKSIVARTYWWRKMVSNC